MVAIDREDATSRRWCRFRPSPFVVLAGTTNEEDEMSDVTVKRVEDFDSPNGGGFCRARAGLGVTAFGMQVEQFPPNFEHFPEHDHTDDGQEEVYTLVAGSATLHAGGEQFQLEPGVFARVGPGVTRKITTGSEPCRLLAIGGVPGGVYSAPPFTEEGVPLPG
jgi:mannose-6-phosphate isomerase-like protein (cupin superfamily)